MGGPPRAITPEGVLGAALSVDGRQLLAHDWGGAWHVVDLATGMVRAAAGRQPTDTVAGWSSDGRAACATRVPLFRPGSSGWTFRPALALSCASSLRPTARA